MDMSQSNVYGLWCLGTVILGGSVFLARRTFPGLGEVSAWLIVLAGAVLLGFVIARHRQRRRNTIAKTEAYQFMRRG
jgi:hypothetical protein